MTKPVRSDVQVLMQEVRALEMLADEADVEPRNLQEYWALAADLITLAADIEELMVGHPGAGYDEPEMLALRRRSRGIASRLSQLSSD